MFTSFLEIFLLLYNRKVFSLTKCSRAKTKIASLRLEKEIHTCLAEKSSLLEKLKAIQNSKQYEEVEDSDENNDHQGNSLHMDVDEESDGDGKEKAIMKESTDFTDTTSIEDQQSGCQETDWKMNDSSQRTPSRSTNRGSCTDKTVEVQAFMEHEVSCCGDNCMKIANSRGSHSARVPWIVTSQPNSRLPVPVSGKANTILSAHTSEGQDTCKPPSLRLPAISVPRPPRIKTPVRMPRPLPVIEIPSHVTLPPRMKEPPAPSRFLQSTHSGTAVQRPFTRMFSTPQSQCVAGLPMSKPVSLAQGSSALSAQVQEKSAVMEHMTPSGDGGMSREQNREGPLKSTSGTEETRSLKGVLVRSILRLFFLLPMKIYEHFDA
ncbi:uncharacterized protein LOC101857955 [Aplysia californica]|uniref:Uncharacterized protein LOC101857955 n=1 Tax=Aplysia californica TaxID=6500 RepID=A0ABM0JU99_APLCA|nr:uncharacterized protein LOC101857955 [Aplysia californica]